MWKTQTKAKYGIVRERDKLCLSCYFEIHQLVLDRGKINDVGQHRGFEAAENIAQGQSAYCRECGRETTFNIIEGDYVCDGCGLSDGIVQGLIESGMKADKDGVMAELMKYEKRLIEAKKALLTCIVHHGTDCDSGEMFEDVRWAIYGDEKTYDEIVDEIDELIISAIDALKNEGYIKDVGWWRVTAKGLAYYDSYTSKKKSRI